ncbi:DegV family protein [Chitinimonas sp. BJYL2]|uniref:DegV family protein n=1 Tax=Chitinimonas sp. BJYL2 TaxID=2976696 RepID=UPI0022B4B646|nr:DegV family protein [Chitinimonas sp. BJYL2]
MRIGIVTDSSCDLPRSFLDQHKIVIMPITIHGPKGDFIDTRDPVATLDFYRDVISHGEGGLSSSPFDSDQIRTLFLDRLVLEFDYVFCITLMKSRSLIFENATHASLRILNDYRPIRESAGIKAPFSLRVFDSGSLFTGQGLIVSEVARLAAADASSLDIIRHIERLAQHTQAFMVPAGLGQLRNQARARGDKSVGFLTYAIGSALDIKPIVRAYRGDTGPVGKVRGFEHGCDKLFDAAISQIKAGSLIAPTICISYGGDLSVVEAMPGYVRLLAEARPRKIEVLLCEMGTPAGVNVGIGAMSLAIASETEVKLD